MSPTKKSTVERELKLTEDDVREEHRQDVNVPAHYAYMFGVLGFGLVAMLVLMVLLGGGR